MTSLRIALATPPFPKSIEHGMEWVEKFVNEAAQHKAQLVCFPESYIPGLRGLDEPVAPHAARPLEAALSQARAAAKRHGVSVILPMDADHPQGIQNLATVISSEGEILGHQTKNQLDPTEDSIFVPGDKRQVFEVAGVTFGITICHEGFRYPESVRWAARQGAQLVFHPHCTGSNHTGRLLTHCRDRGNPYYEQAMMCRALENTIYFAAVNYAFAYQESATCIFGPTGELVASQPYGEAGLLVNDLDLTRATRLLALRYSPS